MVTDQHSANGVLVNGVRIEHAELKSGDVIGLGDIKLRFEDMTTGAVVGKTSPEVASHLTQILDQENVAKLLDRAKSQAGPWEVEDAPWKGRAADTDAASNF